MVKCLQSPGSSMYHYFSTSLIQVLTTHREDAVPKDGSVLSHISKRLLKHALVRRQYEVLINWQPAC